MRLSINGWPPLASHLSVFVCGLIFANLFSPEQPILTPLEISQSYFRLKNDAYSSLRLSEIKIGESLYWVSHEGNNKKNVCLAPLSPIYLAQIKPFVVLRMSIKDFRLLANWSWPKREIKLISQKDAKNMRNCHVEAKISYGS